MKGQIQTEFFARDTVAVAKGLIGCQLVISRNGQEERHVITETEAYDGPEDLASHASRGKTPRNAPMFERGGIWYVYLCYGVHEMLNLVTGPKDYPAAVLIRGIAGCDGPGKLTKALGIDRRFNARPAIRSEGLWIENKDLSMPDSQILALPRIGVDYAGPLWSSKPWRFRSKLRLNPGSRSAASSTSTRPRQTDGRLGVLWRRRAPG